MDNKPVSAAAPTPQHHINLNNFLLAFERFSLIALTLAPAVAAPFIKNPQAQAIEAAEAPVAAALAQTLAGELAAAPTA